LDSAAAIARTFREEAGPVTATLSPRPIGSRSSPSAPCCLCWRRHLSSA